MYVPVVTLSARESKTIKTSSQRILSKFFFSIDWNEYITWFIKNEFRSFLESNFVGVNRLFVLVYTNQGSNAKRFNAQKYYLPKDIMKIIMSSSLEKMFMTKYW